MSAGNDGHQCGQFCWRHWQFVYSVISHNVVDRVFKEFHVIVYAQLIWRSVDRRGRVPTTRHTIRRWLSTEIRIPTSFTAAVCIPAKVMYDRGGLLISASGLSYETSTWPTEEIVAVSGPTFRRSFHTKYIIATSMYDLYRLCKPTSLSLTLVTGERLNNFIVGLSDVSPAVSSPRRGGSYTVCGQYPGEAPNGGRLRVQCAANQRPFRYVFIMTSTTNMNFCELEVYGQGNKYYCNSPQLSNGTSELSVSFPCTE